MTGSEHFVWWRGRHGDRPHDSRWTQIDEAAFQEIEHRITGRHRLPGQIPDWAEDLFRVARAVFLADKHLRRKNTQDRWTRHIRLSVPVTEHERWRQNTAVQTHLTTLLQTLTGDVWEVDFRRLTSHSVHDVFPDDSGASEVALFSGGLDSLCWAATRARADDSRPLLLVTFRETKLESVQRLALEAVRQLGGGRPVLSLPMSQTPKGDEVEGRFESSSRTRGLLYVVGAIRAATAHRAPVVHLPENGQLALNPPLTRARSAACSTRSVHPKTLRHLNALVSAVSDAKVPVRVVNPWARLTKGEVCVAGRDAGLTSSDLESTLSCGKPPIRRVDGPPLANCGICFPCLVRRSGLRHANGSDHTQYETLPWANDLPFERGTDWRALQRWLLTPYALTDLLTDTPLPSDTDPAEALEVIIRGRAELTRQLQVMGAAGATDAAPA